MTAVQFKRLFSINLQHNYFADGKAKAISLKPDFATQKVLNNLGLQIKEKEGGLMIFGKSKMLELLSKEEKLPVLTFHIDFSDQFFFNYTHLPADFDPIQSKSVLFFHNKGGKETLQNGLDGDDRGWLTYGAERHVLILGKDENGSNDALMFDATHEDTLTIALKDIMTGGELIWEQEVTGKPAYDIDLSQEQSGPFTLEVNGEEISSFCLLHKQKATLPLGIVNIYLDEIFQSWSEKEISYVIPFTSRKTYWKYFIIPEQEQIDWVKLEIKNKRSSNGSSNGNGETKSVSFKEIKEEKDANPIRVNGKKAFLFMSKESINLQEEYHQLYQLAINAKKRIEGTKIDMVMDLPGANSRRLKLKEKSEGNIIEYCSEIYIYL